MLSVMVGKIVIVFRFLQFVQFRTKDATSETLLVVLNFIEYGTFNSILILITCYVISITEFSYISYIKLPWSYIRIRGTCVSYMLCYVLASSFIRIGRITKKKKYTENILYKKKTILSYRINVKSFSVYFQYFRYKRDKKTFKNTFSLIVFSSAEF